jgi:hypothetical protein
MKPQPAIRAKGPSVLDSVRAEVDTTTTGDLEVVVIREKEMFEEFVSDVFDSMVVMWDGSHANTPFPVSNDAFRRYCYTAVRVRIARVRNERAELTDGIRCDSEWALPTQIARLLSGLGRVLLEAPIVLIQPIWNDEHNAELLKRRDFDLVSRGLRSFERTTQGVVLAHQIEGQKTGDAALMSLIPVRDAAGRMLQVRSEHNIDGLAAMNYMLLDMHPYGLETGSLSAHALLMPPYFIRAANLHSVMHRVAETGDAA